MISVEIVTFVIHSQFVFVMQIQLIEVLLSKDAHSMRGEGGGELILNSNENDDEMTFANKALLFCN